MRLLTSIQTLRAVAAIAVVFVHAGYDAARYSGNAWLEEAGNLGQAGVDVFFVISGFIMFLTACRSPTASPVTFVADRICRIVPLYWLVTLALLGLAMAGRSIEHPSPQDLAKSMAFLPVFNAKGEVSPFLPVGWTLVYEMFFYALLAVALAARPRHVALLTTALVLLAAGGTAWPGDVASWWTVYTSPILLEFVAGLWIGWAWDKGWRLPAPAGAVLAAMGLGLIVLLYGHSFRNEGWLRLLAWGVPAVCLVLGTLALEGQTFVATRLGLLLGAASYSIYLIHPLVLIVLGRVWLVSGLASAFVIFVGSTLASIVAGVACHLLLEKPLVRWSKMALGISSARSRKAGLAPDAPR
ncbi:MAG: acyltransferase [Alsobacter sp.]